MLQDLAARACGVDRAAGGEPPGAPPYVVAEKILSGHETPAAATGRSHGTTGYGFLNDVNGVFVDAPHARRSGASTRSSPAGGDRSTTCSMPASG